jgi:hypothetical protein
VEAVNRRRPRIKQSMRTKRRAARLRRFAWRFEIGWMSWSPEVASLNDHITHFRGVLPRRWRARVPYAHGRLA